MSKTFAILLLLFVPVAARAHDGPPFPLVLDEVSGPYKVSIWTDPDVGTGKFWVFVDRQDGEATEEVRVLVSVTPTSGRLAEATYPAERQVVGRRIQYFGEVEFDLQEMWKVRVEIDGPPGKVEVVAEVEATPPGLGRWDLVVYLFPFVLLAGLWVMGVVRGRHRRTRTSNQARESVCSDDRS